MSDTTHSDSTTPRRRRFPLTLAALAGCAIAIPLYMVVTTMSADEDAAGEAKIAVANAPVPTESANRRDTAAPTPTATATPSDPFAGDVAIEEEAPAAEPADMPAAPPPSGAMADDAVVGGYGGEAGKMAESAGGLDFRSAPSKAKRAKGGGGGRGLGLDGASAPHPEGALEMDKDESRGGDDGDGFDQQMRAGQLTAGILDDVTSRTSLDELRAKLGYDVSISQAIPDHGAAAPLPHDVVTPGVLEIGLVMDTTGSMGDELEYLKTELRSIAQAVETEYPGVEQRFALVAYRDHGDEYVVREHGFAPLDSFLDHLGHERAGGGGDMPEAMDEAMAAVSHLQWSDNAAKMVFLVADAPPHTQGYQTYVKATASLADAEVSVYPVASSGIDTQCEYLMRWAARTTGGKYLFLTDHSGIGNAHAAPHAPSYELKSLRSHMLDVIRDELGTPGQPQAQAPGQSDVRAIEGHGEPWYDRHAVLLWILGGMFMMGFAADMSRAWFSLRRHI
jgi:hypothetical protein